MAKFSIPADTPEILQAKKAGDQLSQIEYKKPMRDNIDQMRGYQTLDPKDHPVMKQKNKLKEISDVRSNNLFSYLVEYICKLWSSYVPKQQCW